MIEVDLGKLEVGFKIFDNEKLYFKLFKTLTFT